MELERPRPVLHEEEVSTLPPPPAPFPTEQISPALSGEERRETSDLQKHISAVQRSCVDTLADLLSASPTLEEPLNLSSQDQRLAVALTELLEVTYDLESSDAGPLPADEGDTGNAFQALTGRLEDLQNASRTSATAGQSGDQSLHPSVYAPEQCHRAFDQGEEEAQEARESGQDKPNGFHEAPCHASAIDDESLPPRYSLDGHEELEQQKDPVPDYANDQQPPLAEQKSKNASTSSLSLQSTSAPKEKMMLELDGLTDAIDRLHSVTPRLNDHRVEMKASSSKTPTSRELRARAEREKIRELESIWDQIERTHGKRRMGDGQRVDVADWSERRARQKERYLQSLFDGAKGNRLSDQDSHVGKVDAELARARDLRNRDLFFRDLVEQSTENRFKNQDADGTNQAAALEARRQRFFASIMDRNQSGHLASQEYPLTMDERLTQRRQDFFTSLVTETANGRLNNQDSVPPTPRTRTATPMSGHADELVSMTDFFKEGKHDHERSASVSTNGDIDKKVNGFDRIKGMIRRRSAGLGLGVKVNEDVDLANLSYIAEHQENLNVVQVMVHGDKMSTYPELFIETDSETSEEATLVSKGNTSQVQIRLPVPVQGGQRVPLAAPHFHLEAKLTAILVEPSKPVSSLNTMITQALCAADLRRISPTVLCCTGCDREIAELPVKCNFKDLPSEHWAEMMEVWMCHSDPGFTAQISAQTRDGFWPSENTVLVGGSYLLLGDQYIKKHNLLTDSTSDSGWKAVTCSCGEVLGKQRDEDGKPGSGTMRFSKWSIALPGNNDDSDYVESIRFPLSVFVVSDMLELAQAHASYRFSIADENTGQIKLLIWLFNPSVRISYRRIMPYDPSPRKSTSEKRRSFTSSKSRRSSNASVASTGVQTIGPHSLRTSKIMYKILDDGDSHETVPGFGPDGQVESLSYPGEVCDRLKVILRESNSYYPVARRTMSVFEVGFLERV